MGNRKNMYIAWGIYNKVCSTAISSTPFLIASRYVMLMANHCPLVGAVYSKILQGKPPTKHHARAMAQHYFDSLFLLFGK